MQKNAETQSETLTAQIRQLTPDQQEQVKHLVETLQQSSFDSSLTQASQTLSEPSFAAIWNNPEDEAYDAL